MPPRSCSEGYLQRCPIKRLRTYCLQISRPTETKSFLDSLAPWEMLGNPQKVLFTSVHRSTGQIRESCWGGWCARRELAALSCERTTCAKVGQRGRRSPRAKESCVSSGLPQLNSLNRGTNGVQFLTSDILTKNRPEQKSHS